MNTRSRALAVLAIAGVIAGLTASGVYAAKPVRTPVDLAPQYLDAGFACPFDVEILPVRGHVTQTDFSDGRTTIVSSVEQMVTNLAPGGGAVTVRDRGILSTTYDSDANDLYIEASGQTIFYFFPGDQGPFGEVGENGGLFHVVGHVRETWDLDQDLITSFSLDGSAIDLCALIDS